MRAFAAISAALAISASASAEPTLEDLSFLVGDWRGGGEDFVFEETWSTASGGVMTGMARGVAGGDLQVLEYIVIEETSDGLIMRFKHFRADYSTWEADRPVTLDLTSLTENDVIFSADPPSETVQSIRYWMPDDRVLQVDVSLVEDTGEAGFSLVFDRVE